MHRFAALALTGSCPLLDADSWQPSLFLIDIGFIPSHSAARIEPADGDICGLYHDVIIELVCEQG